MTVGRHGRGRLSVGSDDATVIRSPPLSRTVGDIGLLFLALVALIAVAKILDDHGAGPRELALIAFMLVGEGLLAWSIWRVREVQVRIEPERIVVRNPWKTYEVGTNEVASLRTGMNRYGSIVGIIELRSGKPIRAAALVRSSGPEQVAEANQYALLDLLARASGATVERP